MRVRVIGAGNANSRRNGNTSFLVEEDVTYEGGIVTERFLIDCGRTTPDDLYRLGIDPRSIGHIYISHAHSDHCGGLEDIAFSVYDWMNKPQRWDDYLKATYPDGRKKPYWAPYRNYRQYAPILMANETLMQELWDETLKGGMATMEGFPATLETFFRPLPVAPNQEIEWNDWTLKLIQQVHVMTGSVTKSSFGLVFSKPDHKTVYFTTDSQHCSPEQMEVFYKEADIIFQDCELIGCDFRAPEGQEVEITEPCGSRHMEEWGVFKYTSKVHANYAKLAGYPSANAVKLDSETKAKMYLAHYQDFKLDNRIDPAIDKDFVFDWDEQARKDGFAGFVRQGDVLEFGRVSAWES